MEPLSRFAEEGELSYVSKRFLEVNGDETSDGEIRENDCQGQCSVDDVELMRHICL